ncbi:MAG: Hypothetical protein BHV28_02930 [Candidatus Tokpelaia hoelldobleri]|uniref:Transmembrane protein n=1 Tax=Candidatus Tokpelaia hoelldobleri TaxID=1902579 RepID=A0A1U9JT29_9HYPH|nr:MAG: Hypothetical protein BHV28_02930 [Candidatus Tokpelaia hoelldoblerii]
MADFVGLLKKTIDAQKNATPELRARIYLRTRQTVEKKLFESKVAPEVAEMQRRIIEKAIREVEAFYLLAETQAKQQMLQMALADQGDAGGVAPPAQDVTAFLQAQEDNRMQAAIPAVPATGAPAGRVDKKAGLPPLAIEEKRLAVESPNGDFDLVSDIFGQAAKREQQRSGNKRLARAGAIIAVIAVISLVSVWFLTGFLQQVEETQPVALEDSRDIPLPPEGAVEVPEEKMTQRLLPDGREVDPGVADGADGPVASIDGNANQATAAAIVPVAEALFYEGRTETESETSQTGKVEWSILNSVSEEGEPDMAIRGEVQIPDRDMKLLITIRRNTDVSMPAAVLAELVFVVPDDFDGGAVDQIGQLMFKPAEQSRQQDLQGTVMPHRLNENFFLVTINAPRPMMEYNLNIMRQLQWLKLYVQYSSGRYGEFSLAKGEGGDAIFKQVIDSWRAKGYIYNARAPEAPVVANEVTEDGITEDGQ